MLLISNVNKFYVSFINLAGVVKSNTFYKRALQIELPALTACVDSLNDFGIPKWMRVIYPINSAMKCMSFNL